MEELSFYDLALLARASLMMSRAVNMLIDRGQVCNNNSLVLLLRAAAAGVREEYDTNATQGQKVQIARLLQARNSD